MMQTLHKKGQEVGLLPRQVDGQVFALQTGRIARSDYMEITDVSPVTASRDLAQLVELGFLIAEGKTRSRVYRPSEPKAEAPPEQLPLMEASRQ